VSPVHFPIHFAQINATVGDLEGNAERILASYRIAESRGAALVLTPELALTGYPPLDLVFKNDFVPRAANVLERLAAETSETALLVGTVTINHNAGKPFLNSVAILQHGKVLDFRHKTLLPTYDVFDEDRYFEPASPQSPLQMRLAGTPISLGITICEDVWSEEYLPRNLYHRHPITPLKDGGMDLLVNLSASPFQCGKPMRRREMLAQVARSLNTPLAYCNAVGANDQLIFDGQSCLFGPDGSQQALLPAFEEADLTISEPTQVETDPSDGVDALHDALVLGIRDYFRKCGFKSAILGLSGGIDSAVVACLATAALGGDNVTGVTMPTCYSSHGSIEDSETLAQRLGIHFLNISIQPAFEAVSAQLSPYFNSLPPNETEENLQPRLRGITLMALSNKFGHLVLSTGNKSEMAVGYCTLYGDMCGGLSVISDVPKTKVYELAEYINRDGVIIPVNTITKPPSAELKPDQTDQDTLPPYPLLDAILERYVVQQQSVDQIVKDGFPEETVRWVARRVDLNEYKRAQAAPGLKVTSRAFGVGRKMPIAQRFRP
jgi:NAD+ synthase (glutamine-hydrolysing)